MSLSSSLRVAALTLTAAGALALVAATPGDANACGGFFCSQVPIDQRGEQIIFGIGDGTITAQIQISYTGEAKDFAWVVPVASVPELSVGSQAAFTAVNQATQPNYWLDWDYNANGCGFYWPQASAVDDSDGGTGGGGVSVIAQEEVGPYDTVVLSSSNTQELVDWLNDNGFDQPPESTPLIDHYVQSGMLFVALKLQQDEGVGDIQPIVMEFEEADPCVPLVLTQVAAVPDMPVRLFILGEHRSVPTNWMHVVVNEKKIDWINNGANYDDVVTQAVNEAAGHGFVTEFAGSSERMKDRLYRDGQYDLARVAAISDPSDILDELLRQGFPRDSTMQAILRKHIPMPQSLVDQGIDERQFYNSIGQYESAIDYVVDSAALADDLDRKLVTPLKDAQALFDDHPYLTRLYTTVSPEEMTRDPLFSENPDLGDVDNNHRASASATCDPNNDGEIESVTITLADGQVYELTGPFNQWGGWQIDFTDPAPDEPAAKRIELIGRTGAPVLVDPSQVAQVDEALDKITPEQVIDDVENNVIQVIKPPVVSGTGSSGCQGGDLGASAALAVLLLGGLVVARRRRREDAV